ncbi:hypothetical protein BJ322DRAFT_785422 [Thelephora terrestris]|uniref:Uncharacterized protein n=1 Tax=Thelephora terrestris TaxID=56493 RepID=A0A9P6HG28_9AGAM|nr:hypothetical protein BJ322DRAFT_785422 [Thelephora terrestris]
MHVRETTWDYLNSLWFEYRLLTGKIRFRWHFVPYFLARYSVLALATMSAVDVLVDAPMGPACPRAVLENLILHLGFLTLVFGTWNLLTRTLIIWGHNPLLMKMLSAVGLAQLALALILSSVGRNLYTIGPPSALSITLSAATTAFIELAILLLSLVGIRRASIQGESYLARLLKNQGIAYFVMTFLIQVSAIAITLANVDDATRMWVGVSGSILSPILSCRLVTSTLSENGPSYVRSFYTFLQIVSETIAPGHERIVSTASSFLETRAGTTPLGE